MTTRPELDTNKDEGEGEECQTQITPPTQPKREVYPEVNGRFMGAILWLGLAFVVMVLLLQNFSGYS
ncbi:MAG: hypothetical protein ABL884_08430 [Methyloglobulus sp.]